MDGVDPRLWLDYGALGAALLLLWVEVGLIVWMVRYAFGLIERVNSTFGKLLAQRDDEDV